MADGSGQRPSVGGTSLATGDILVWRMQAASADAAEARAVELAGIAERLALGEASWAPVGLNTGGFWFDLVLTRQVEASLIELIFGKPRIY